MRAAPFLSLLIPAACGAGLGLLLVSCHKDRPPPAKPVAAAQRTLKLQAYDPPIPKAPVAAAKLETIAPHPMTPPAPKIEVQAAPPPEVRVPRPHPARVYADAQPGPGRFIDARQAGTPAPDDPRYDASPEPAGFRLTVPLCRNAARLGDPLADTAECRGILEAARAQAEACARAFEVGDDRVVLSPACRQAATAR